MKKRDKIYKQMIKTKNKHDSYKKKKKKKKKIIELIKKSKKPIKKTKNKH